ncbi:hypothetical protein AbraIFM66951_003830 [Aspergillus brasiliensis]|uniref:Uncharacterized protein n=1 Tax=Aspergillus brasiliensis TaxID=319629 RepID=A0A9W5YRT0_9EURO|nr:hypothetical protein AbraCBS73388_006544 [Aspergillus brasiliensis]GKZ50570.1 hypothetical protein AbraIFM66951_003830 [Aspergillus brasiliensis]
MGKSKAEAASESSQKRRSPRFLDKQHATGTTAIEPKASQIIGSNSAVEPKPSSEAQASTEVKVDSSSAVESKPSPEAQASTEAKVDSSSAVEPKPSPELQASTEPKQPEVPLDELGMPKVPDERRPGKPIVWTRPQSLSHQGEWQEAYKTTWDMFLKLDMISSNWVSSYCYRGAELRDRLSAGDLQIILDSLGDFCLHKDWKSIEARLDETGHRNFWYLLPSAVLMKPMFEEVIANPFVYIQGSREGTGGQSSLDPPAFGKELWELWKRLAKVDPVRASDWRKTTTQLLNQVHPKYTKDWTVAYRTGEAQESLAHRLATGLLTECKALQVILKEMTNPDDVTQRYERLVNMYRTAIEISVYLGTLDTEFEFEMDVKRCGPYLHRKTRVRKRGSSDEVYPDEWPIPVLLSLPLVSGRYLVTSDNLKMLERRRGEVRYFHRNDGKEDLQKRVDKEVPEVEEGDTILFTAIRFANIVFAKDGPRACQCGGRFICQSTCEIDSYRAAAAAAAADGSDSTVAVDE